jgi:hypothetical protein
MVCQGVQRVWDGQQQCRDGTETNLQCPLSSCHFLGPHIFLYTPNNACTQIPVTILSPSRHCEPKQTTTLGVPVAAITPQLRHAVPTRSVEMESDSLTPCSRVLPEKLTGSQLVKKFSAFYGARKFITAYFYVHTAHAIN